jgi:hypothetical protein
MLKFIKSELDRPMLQFIVNLLYLGMKSGNCCWAQHNGTEQAVKDLLSTVPDSFISTANNILVNGSIKINVDQRRLKEHLERHIDVEQYQDIVDVLRGGESIGDFSRNCRQHFERLLENFPYMTVSI